MAAATLLAGSVACSPTKIVVVDLGSARLSVGDSVLVGAAFGHHHFGLFNDDIHANSRDQPTAFRWSSSDSSVAGVDARGMVYARRPGKAEVTAEYDGLRPNFPALIEVTR